MHLKEKKTLFELHVGIKFTLTAVHYLQHHVTYANLKFAVATYNSLAGYAFTRKHYLTLTFGPRSHKMLSRTLYIMWPMHMQRLKLLHPSLGGDAFTRKHIFGLDPVPSTSCDLCTYKVWSCCIQCFRDAFTRKYIIWPLTLTLRSISH